MLPSPDMAPQMAMRSFDQITGTEYQNQAEMDFYRAELAKRNAQITPPDTGSAGLAAPSLGTSADMMGEMGWLQRLASDAAKQRGVPVQYLQRLLQQESGWNPQAYNASSGAAGIAQFMPGTAKEYGIDPYNPAQAIPAAAKYLQNMSNYYNGDWALSIAAYNYGPGNVDRALAKGGEHWREFLPDETTLYLKNVYGY